MNGDIVKSEMSFIEESISRNARFIIELMKALYTQHITKYNDELIKTCIIIKNNVHKLKIKIKIMCIIIKIKYT